MIFRDRRANKRPFAFHSLLAIVFSCAGATKADILLDDPFSLSDRGPLTQRFNLPALRSGTLLASDRSQWRAAVDIANNFIREVKGDERLVLDGETQRYELSARYGLGAGWEIGATVPWISFNGGVLDSFIEAWHRNLGFPSGGRRKFPEHQLQFFYQRGNNVELNYQHAGSGFGDAQMQIANQLLATTRDNLALIATLNLPTGDEHKLTGAGGTSAGIALAATHSDWLDLPLTLTGNIGVQTLPNGDVLSGQQKNHAWFGGGEIAWATAPDWRLRAQINAHSAIYDSALTPLGETSVQLLLGGSVRVAPRAVFDISLAEDIAVDTAPDVTMQIGIRGSF